MGLDISAFFFPLACKIQGAKMGENRLDKSYQSILGEHFPSVSASQDHISYYKIEVSIDSHSKVF
jgi:hypothetical protein